MKPEMSDLLTVLPLEAIKYPLVQKLYKSHYSSGRVKSDERVIAAYHSHEMIGVLRLKSVGEHRLLTGMVVVPTYRKQKIGSVMLQYCKHNELQATDYCFSYVHLESFYQQHGFKTLDALQLPEQLLTLFSTYCRSGKALVPMIYCG